MLQNIFKKRSVYEKGFNFYMESGDPRRALDVALKGRLGDEAVYKAATTLYEKHMSEGEFREAEKIAIEFKMPEDAVKAARVCDLRSLARHMEHESESLHAEASKLFDMANAIQDAGKRNEEPAPATINLKRSRISEECSGFIMYVFSIIAAYDSFPFASSCSSMASPTR